MKRCEPLTPSRMTTNLRILFNGAIAQLGERCNGIAEVGGSIPPSSTIQLSRTPVDLPFIKGKFSYSLIVILIAFN